MIETKKQKMARNLPKKPNGRNPNRWRFGRTIPCLKIIKSSLPQNFTPSSFSKVIRPAPIDHDGHNTTASIDPSGSVGDEYSSPKTARLFFFQTKKKDVISIGKYIWTNHWFSADLLVASSGVAWPCRAPCRKGDKVLEPKNSWWIFSVVVLKWASFLKSYAKKHPQNLTWIPPKNGPAIFDIYVSFLGVCVANPLIRSW